MAGDRAGPEVLAGAFQPGDRQHAGLPGRIPDLGGRRGGQVAGAGDHHHVPGEGVVERRGQGRAVAAAAERQVDHPGAVVHRPAHPLGDDERVVVAVLGVEHPDREDLGVRRQPHHAPVVVGPPGDQRRPRWCRARPDQARPTPSGVTRSRPGRTWPARSGCDRVDTGIDHRDHHAGARSRCARRSSPAASPTATARRGRGRRGAPGREPPTAAERRRPGRTARPVPAASADRRRRPAPTRRPATRAGRRAGAAHRAGPADPWSHSPAVPSRQTHAARRLPVVPAVTGQLGASDHPGGRCANCTRRTPSRRVTRRARPGGSGPALT